MNYYIKHDLSGHDLSGILGVVRFLIKAARKCAIIKK